MRLLTWVTLMNNTKLNGLFISFNQCSADVLNKYLQKSTNLKCVAEFYDDPSPTERDFLSWDLHELRVGNLPITHEKFNNSTVSYVHNHEEIKNEAREVSAIMLTRQSFEQDSICFNVRNVYFEKMWNFYKEFLINMRVHVIIFRCVPHFSSEYILSRVAASLGIICISKEDIDPIQGSFLINLNDRSKLCYFYGNQHKNKEKKEIFENRIEKFIYENSNFNAITAPLYYTQNLQASKSANGLWGTVKELFSAIVGIVIKLGRRNYITLNSLKSRDLEFRQFKSEFFWRLSRFKARKQINKNEQFYNSLCVNSDLDFEVMIAPSYQPERTSIPDCGVYGDLIRFLTIINDNIPADLKIGYKEHAANFNIPSIHFYRGHLYRSFYLYKNIMSAFRNITFLHSEKDILPYLKNCKLLIAQSSSAVYQASLLGKKAVTFGYSWFSECELVHRYTNSTELKRYVSEEKDECNVDDCWRQYLTKMMPYLFKTDNLIMVCEKNNSDFLEQLQKSIEYISINLSDTASQKKVF